MNTDKNRRSHARIRTLLQGRIVFNRRGSLIDCAVRDLSESGARIEFATPFEPPADFELEVPTKKLTVWARRMWSSGTNHGVMFFEPSAKGEMAPITEEKALRLQRILQETRRQIAMTVGIAPELVHLSLDLPSNDAARFSDPSGCSRIR